ncbi:MAG: YciI family protein [Imperialibacter sp.]|uniref:YciI family protein n=1 Tax=Imperialibacter sp. TaxID=2038411 RepID=UPI0032EC42F3
MKEFLILLRGGAEARKASSPEEMQAHMQRWGAWMQKQSENGTLVGGLPLSAEGKQVSGGGKVITDGPYTEGKEVIVGYLIIKAADLKAAAAISQGCPFNEHHGVLEVREITAMM